MAARDHEADQARRRRPTRGREALPLARRRGARPPAVFDDPDTFDIERDNARRHTAFGKGIHFCLGSALGKLETQLALEELTRRFPDLRLMPDQELSFQPNISFRGPQQLWVTTARA